MNHELLFAVSAGFLMGLQHAGDADHVVAVSTLVTRSGRPGASWRLGAAWGLGHSATLLAVGSAIVLLKLAVPERLGLAFEFAVGGMLAVLGVLNVAGWRPGGWGEAHRHEHEHGDDAHGTHGHHVGVHGRHSHEHVHAHALDRLAREAGGGRLARSFAVGVVHGLAGSSAAALLVLSAMPGPAAALLYLAVFGVGTLAGMTAVSALLAFSVARLGGGGALLRLAPAAGLLSVALGGYIMFRIGYVEGLLR